VLRKKRDNTLYSTGAHGRGKNEKAEKNRETRGEKDLKKSSYSKKPRGKEEGKINCYGT